MKTTLENIAHKHLGFETLETRNSDSLDFHNVAVWSVKSALEDAYHAGQSGSEDTVLGTRAFNRHRKDDNVMAIAKLDLLTKAARGEIDLNLLARMELAARGLDANGDWIGFDKAKALHGV